MIRCVFVCALLLVWSSATSAFDPFTLMLLRMMRDHTISATLEASVNSMREQPAPPVRGWTAIPAPAPGNEVEQLKTVIDESFVYLTAEQRDAVHAGLMKVLSDPRNAAVKPQIIAEFRIKAKEVRDTYRSLDRLSWTEKKTLAAQAREQYRKLPGDQKSELLDVVRSGMLPIPRDLNDMLLEEFAGTPPLVSDAGHSH